MCREKYKDNTFLKLVSLEEKVHWNPRATILILLCLSGPISKTSRQMIF